MKNIKDMIGKPILDIPCKFCKSDDTYTYDTDETEFSYDGTGHYYADYHCKSCSKDFRVLFDFKYEITDAGYHS